MPKSPAHARSRARVLAVLLTFAGAACTAPPEPLSAKPGDLAPVFEAPDLQGVTVSLSALRGSVVLLNVWATWCEPCREELPELARLAARHRERGLVVIGVSVDGLKAQDELRRLVDASGVTYPILLDPRSTIVPKLKIVGFPTTVLIDRQGVSLMPHSQTMRRARLGGPLDVVARARRDLLEHDLLRDAPAHQDRDAHLGVVAARCSGGPPRELLRDAQRAAARDDRDLVDRIGAGQQPSRPAHGPPRGTRWSASPSEMIIERRSAPISTLSLAASKSSIVTTSGHDALRAAPPR
jgi:cytochrome c biogenesis protein CcmG/thiol:disulfide interchange protein DsbE